MNIEYHITQAQRLARAGIGTEGPVTAEVGGLDGAPHPAEDVGALGRERYRIGDGPTCGEPAERMRNNLAMECLTWVRASDPWVTHGEDNDELLCFFCGAYANIDNKEHEPDCIWKRAQEGSE